MSLIKVGQLGFAGYDEVCHGHDINTIPLFLYHDFCTFHVCLFLSGRIHAQYIILIFIEVRVLIFIRNGLSAPLLILRWTAFFVDIRSSEHIQVT